MSISEILFIDFVRNQKMAEVPSNMRLLLIVVESVNEARRLVTLGDDFSYMRAVFALDFAVEQMLNVLIDNFAPDTTFGRDNIAWETLWQTATTAVGDANVITDRIPHHRQLKKLHEIRNLSQHHGCTPHGSDVAQLVDPVVRMISVCFERCFDLSFENFRLWDVIQNPRLRELLAQCEQALENGIPRGSLIGSNRAFIEIASEMGKENPFSSSPPQFIHYEDRRRWEQWISGVTKNLEQLHIDSILASLGLALAETQEFRRLTREIPVTVMSDGSWNASNRSTRTDDELKTSANFALGYLSRLALRAQEVYPDALARVSFKKLLYDQEWMRDTQS
jgi:hypothetical protein